MSDNTKALVLALATENSELRAALADAQELLIETAVDAGELHAEVEALRVQIVALKAAEDLRSEIFAINCANGEVPPPVS